MRGAFKQRQEKSAQKLYIQAKSRHGAEYIPCPKSAVGSAHGKAEDHSGGNKAENGIPKPSALTVMTDRAQKIIGQPQCQAGGKESQQLPCLP